MENEIQSVIGVITGFVPRLLAGTAVLVGFWLASVVVRRLIRRIANVTDPGRSDVLLLAAQASRVTLLLVGLVSALGTLGINVSALVAGLGLTGFALGFALQNVLSNAVAGVLILFYAPFVRGDRIAVKGMSGEVVAIDLRYTTLQDGDARLLIPNAVVFTESVKVDGTG